MDGGSGEVGGVRMCMLCALHSRGLYGVSVQSRVILLAWSVGGFMGGTGGRREVVR